MFVKIPIYFSHSNLLNNLPNYLPTYLQVASSSRPQFVRALQVHLSPAWPKASSFYYRDWNILFWLDHSYILHFEYGVFTMYWVCQWKDIYLPFQTKKASVWPDLEKFDHLGKISQVFGITASLLLQIFNVIGQISLLYLKGQILLEQFSHLVALIIIYSWIWASIIIPSDSLLIWMESESQRKTKF